MSDILCTWLNSDLRLSKFVEPRSFSSDFASGYLIGEVLHKHRLQGDFDKFCKSSTASSKFNNYSRVEPTLHMLGVPFDLAFAQALMQGRPGAAKRLLYQLYALLHNKKSGVESMPAGGIAHRHRTEKQIYTERLRVLVRRDADRKLREVSRRYESTGRNVFHRFTMTPYEQSLELQKHPEDSLLWEIEKHREARKEQHKIMIQNQLADMEELSQTREPPQQEAQNVQMEIDQFEKKKKKLSSPVTLPFSTPGSSSDPGQLAKANDLYLQKIRQKIKADVEDRERGEKRRRMAFLKQLQAVEEQHELLGNEQLVARITRQSQQEKRLAAQLMQIRQQKEILRQNRMLMQRQIQEQCQQDFHNALQREVALAQQAQVENAEQLRLEMELHKRKLKELHQACHRKQFDACQEIVRQLVDLATKAGEHRLLTGKLVPAKKMREWKELFFCALPLYSKLYPSEQISMQLAERESAEVLNEQDYDDYNGMMGDWACSEDGEMKQLPDKKHILDHMISQLQATADKKRPKTLRPVFPTFKLKACVLGKAFSGKTACLSRIAEKHGIHVLSISELLQDALEAFRMEEVEDVEEELKELTHVCHRGDGDRAESDAEKARDVSTLMEPGTQIERGAGDHGDLVIPQEKITKASVRAQLGAAAEQILRRGESIPDDLMVDVVVEAIRRLPAASSWILDGFPGNRKQAKFLEKALCESDLDEEDRKTQGRKSSLAVDPKEALLPLPVLNIVLLLEVSDTTVLERVIKQTSIEAQSTLRQAGSGRANKNIPAQPHLDKDLKMKLIQQRLTSFYEKFPKLETWYSQKQILVKVDADNEMDVVVEKVESLLFPKEEEQECVNKPDGEMTPEESHGEMSNTNAVPSENMDFVDKPLPKRIEEYLLPYWEKTNSRYKANIRVALEDLRNERDLITHHLYRIRQEMEMFLRKPDLKQEYVSHWQQDYNSFPEDMRNDEDAKAELHQRLDRLQRTLWDICDQREDDALQEHAGLKGNNWLEDHTALLINSFSFLMKVEVDRFQDILYILQDYHNSMSGEMPQKVKRTFLRLPWAMDHVSHAGSPTALDVNSAGRQNQEEKTKLPQKIVPVMSPVEKIVLDMWNNAMSAVTSMVEAETKCQEECEEQQRTSRMSVCGKSGRDRKKPDKKRGTPALVKIRSTPVDEDPAMALKRKLKEKIQQQYAAALNHEAGVVKVRLELIKARSLCVVHNLQQEAELVFRAMKESAKARFQTERASVDRFVLLARHHIESAIQIENELWLRGTDFYINEDKRVIPTPANSPAKPLVEPPANNTFAIYQLGALYNQFSKVAPTGQLCAVEFSGIIQKLICSCSDNLPKNWLHLTKAHIREMVSVLCQESETLDWRRFLLCAALPWPFPSQNDLVKAVGYFREADTLGTGFVSEDIYDKGVQWIPSLRHMPTDDPCNPPTFDRLGNLKKFFFTLFAEHSFTPPLLPYETMLLFFAPHPDSIKGWVRALSVVTGYYLSYSPSSIQLHKSVPYAGEKLQDCRKEAEEAEAAGTEEATAVSISALLKVVCHCRTRPAKKHRLNHSWKTREEYEKDFRNLYTELQCGPGEEIAFAILAQHPMVRDLMENSKQFQLSDIHQFLEFLTEKHTSAACGL